MMFPVMRRFGDRATFAVEGGGLPDYVVAAGATQTSEVREVDVWAGGKCLTRHDNAAFVPTLVPDMRYSAELVRRKDVPARPFPWRSPAEVFRLLHANETEFRQRFWLMNTWDEIMDSVETYTWLDGPLLVIAARIHRPVHTDIFVARVPQDEFLTTVDEAATFLSGLLPARP
jgi:hypothetical protein